MKPDLIKIILCILGVSAIGMTLGYALEFGLIASFLCNVWLLLRAKSLHHWFKNNKEQPHAEEGVFYALHHDINAMRQKHKAEKKELKKNLKKALEASTALPIAIVMIDSFGDISWSNPLAGDLLAIKHPRDNGHRLNSLLRHPSFTAAYSKRETVPVNIDIEAPTNRAITINLKIIDLAENMQMVVARDISRHVDNVRSQKDFVGNVSHELKTPLTVVRGYLELLTDSPNVDHIKKPIDNMLSQTKRMQSTIDDLLYLAKLDNETSSLGYHNQKEELSVSAIVQPIMESAEILAERNNQKIHTDIDDTLPITGIKSELETAFSNLVTNALRYTPEGGSIYVKWKKENNHGVFSVTDTGIGIAPNHLGRLTERFYNLGSGSSFECIFLLTE